MPVLNAAFIKNNKIIKRIIKRNPAPIFIKITIIIIIYLNNKKIFFDIHFVN